MDRQPRHIDVITMGCSKNLVDSEQLMHRFERVGCTVAHNPETLGGGDVVVNTCGFIGDAKEESINMILECCQAKARGEIDRVFVMGCLSQRYAEDLPTEIPEVDGWCGKFDWDTIIERILSEDCNRETPKTPKYSRELTIDATANTSTSSPSWQRHLTTPSHHAYIKIAEGCNRFCAFCAIPIITGRFKSRPIEEIADEVRDMVSRGVREFNIIAQELTSYGIDIYGKRQIARLVDTIAEIPGVKWIRLHYAYPTDFPRDLLDAMARHHNVCRYLDIALQHISDNVLSNMRRHITGDETRKLLSEIRKSVPGIHIRTTLMVGFPGEGEKEFAELLDFVMQQRFERMGAFAYCEEDDTYAAKKFTDSVSDEEKQRRLDILMAAQEEIALESNLAKVGTIQQVVIDSETDQYYIGRTQYDSPEIDPEVLVKKYIESDDRRNDFKMKPGEFYQVKIVSAAPFELIAEPI